MSRFGAVFSTEFQANLKRPFFWVWYALLAVNAFLMSTGNWIIRSVDTSVGTQKSFVNSEFQIAFVFALMPFIMMGIFMAIAAGTTILRDEQWRIGEIIHTTPLRPGEYVWGKFLAVLANALLIIGLFVLTLIFLNEVVPHPGSDIHGAFKLRNYVCPAIAFILPALVFTASIAFAIGVFTRRTALVYLFPVFMLLLAMNFLYYWYPPSHTPLQTYMWQVLDPGGFRWLKQTWFRVDRGVGFYNTHSINYDAGFIAGRLLYFILGAGIVAATSRYFARHYARISDVKKKRAVQQPANDVPAQATAEHLAPATRTVPGTVRQILNVAYFELKELAAQPWLFLFIAFIAIAVMLPDRGGRGELHIAQLYTPGLTAAAAFSPVTMLICFLLMFTNGESLAREQSSGLGQLYYSTPLSTTALMTGKAIANFSIAIFAVLVNVITISIFVLYHHEAALNLKPFLYLYVYLMMPTFVFWTAFSMAAFSLSRSRFGTYAAGIIVIAATLWMIANNKQNWVTDWSLAVAPVWSDFGSFQIDRAAYILNRLFYLSLSVSLLAIAVRYFPRRTADARFLRARKESKRIAKIAAAVVLVVLPVVLGSFLYITMENGFEGAAALRHQKEYWSRNLSTYWHAPLPDRTFVDLDLRFDPQTRSYSAHGSYSLINNNHEPLFRFPVTGVGSWDHLHWTLNQKEYQPENRSGLYVFRLDPPLQPQQTMTLGFSYDATMLPGVSKRGGYLQLGEFVLPAGILLTGRNPWFVPVIGFVDSIGVDDKNRYEPQDPDPHFYKDVITSGVDRSLLNTRIRIDVPESFFATSMGVLKSESVSNGRRILVWESDYPVRVFNVAAAHWNSLRGNEGTTIYYKPEHTANLGSLREALDGARHYYSEWWGVYPWKELRLNEFPGVALYARGNPTNIFFSEGIGFLAKDNMEDVVSFGLNAFGITAHEAAHQWWGHMVSVGDAPGGIVLAEGMANFSVMCLLQQMKGDKLRQDFARSIEAFYGENREVTSERPIARSLFFRPADTTVIYDKGAWVFWMMRNLLGKERMNAGLKSFIEKFHSGLDRPVSEDFVQHMRAFAPDAAAYDEFTRQWFFEVVMPEYRYMTKPQKQNVNGGWETRARLKNVGTGRMPIEVGAIRGDQFDPKSKYERASIHVNPAGDQEIEIVIRSTFEPERLVVDPDLNVLQLQRNGATYRFRN